MREYSDRMGQGKESIAAPLFEQIEQDCEESYTLEAIHDTLLPKLMSNGIRVKNAKQILEHELLAI